MEHKSWKKMIKGFCPQYKPPGRKKIALLVFDVFNIEKVKIRSVMTGQRVIITIDTWTLIQNVNYMVVTAHFMDLQCNLHKRIINFTKIYSHKGNDIGRLLMHCLDEWGIKNVLTVIVDKASSNYTSMTYLLGMLKERGNLLFDGIYMHMRCACHILNLIVKDGLQEMNKSVEAIRNAMKYVHSSPAQLTMFWHYAQLELNDEKSNVPTDACTRWNSTFKMLSIASKYKVVFSRLMADDRGYTEYFTGKAGPPVRDDWKKSQTFIFFLERFYDTTLKLSASKSETTNLIYFETRKTIREIEERISDNTPSNTVLKQATQKMKLKFKKYWNYADSEQVNSLIYIAHVLDPRFKIAYLKVSIGKMIGDMEADNKHADGVKDLLLKLYKEYEVDVWSSQRYSIVDESVDKLDDSWLQEMVDQSKVEKRIIIPNDIKDF